MELTPKRISATSRTGQGPTRSFSRLTPLILLLVAVVLLVGCGEESEDVVAVGRSLELHVGRPQIVEKVAYVDTRGGHRVIRPRASNRQLVVLNLVVVNRTALVTSLVIDGDSAKLGDRRGTRIQALDPFADSKPAETISPEENLYSPFLWGETVLDRNFQVEGHLIFDVPKGLILGSFFWDEVDNLVADYVDYRRRRL